MKVQRMLCELLLIFLLISIGVAEGSKKGDVLKDLQLTIGKTDEFPIYPGWPIRVGFDIKNISNRDVEYEFISSFIVMVDNEGKVLERPYWESIKTISFYPGRSYTYNPDISGYFRLQPGQYSVNFVCQTKDGSYVKSNSINISVRKLYDGSNSQIIELLEYINPKNNSRQRKEAVADLAKV